MKCAKCNENPVDEELDYFDEGWGGYICTKCYDEEHPEIARAKTMSEQTMTSGD